MTKGRVAWNVVTSYSNNAAKAMGQDKVTPHDKRYTEAHEFMDIMYSYVTDFALRYSMCVSNLGVPQVLGSILGRWIPAVGSREGCI